NPSTKCNPPTQLPTRNFSSRLARVCSAVLRSGPTATVYGVRAHHREPYNHTAFDSGPGSLSNQVHRLLSGPQARNAILRGPVFPFPTGFASHETACNQDIALPNVAGCPT